MKSDKSSRVSLAIASTGLLLLLIGTFTLPFNHGLFSKLFTKPFSHAATLSANITIDASQVIKSYPQRPPITQSYLPDSTSASYQFAPGVLRYDLELIDIVQSQSAYTTAHPNDTPCGSSGSDCGEGENNGGVPEYNWRHLDEEIEQITNANLAPSVMILIIDSTPNFLESPSGAVDSYPTNLTQYANITGDMWHHIYLKAPQIIPKVYFEVWNEPDRLMTLQQYEDLYAVVGQNIHQTATRFSSTAITGGPVTGVVNPPWFQGLLSNPQDNPYIDFVSWHDYPSADGITGATGDPATDWTSFATQTPHLIDQDVSAVKGYVSQYDTALQKNGGTHSNNIPLFITEYNVSPSVGSYTGGEIENMPEYETPFIGLYTARILNDSLDGLVFYCSGGFPDVTGTNVGTYLVDSSYEIAPWAWTEFLYERSLGMYKQSFSIIQSTTSDSMQFPAALKFPDGTYGVAITNAYSTPETYTVSISNTGLSGDYTVHNYLVDGTHPDVLQPDITGTATSGTITFTVTVPSLSVNGFAIGAGAGPSVELPNYSFHPLLDDFSSYGGAGSTVGPASVLYFYNGNYTLFDPTKWVTVGYNPNNFDAGTGVTATVATPSSDGISFADSAAGASTNAMKLTGSYQSFLRSGSYRADWAIPPGQKVAITFQTDWGGVGGNSGRMRSEVWLTSDLGNPPGAMGAANYSLLLQQQNGIVTLYRGQSGPQTQLGAFTLPSNLTPQAKVLSSWRILIDASTVEVDRFDKVSNSWVSVIGPVAHNLPQTPTGMESGLISLGEDTDNSGVGTTYFANFSVTAFGLSITPSPSFPITPTPTPSASAIPTPSPTPTPKPSSTPSSCPSKTGDFNNDGSVNLTDLSIFAASYGTTSPNIPNSCTDLNQDGSVNLTDLSLFAAVYGT